MILNKSKNTILVKKKKYLTNILSKAKGLMFSKKSNIGYVFVFNKPRRIDLHMFFVFYPIDVLFLDSEKKVIEIKENFKPFTFYFSKHKAKYIIELPQGVVKESKTELGDILKF